MRTSTLLCAASFTIPIVAGWSCTNLTIPVTISARNGNFPQSVNPTTNIEVTDFVLDLTRQGTNYTNEVLEGVSDVPQSSEIVIDWLTLAKYATINGTFNISATYCQPAKGVPKAIQILTHGVGFDRSYWNLPFNDFNYSYTNVAVDQYGFATFAYDRLGIGASQHGDPLNFVQSWTQIAALQALSSMLRQGSIDGIPSFDKVLHVGHSYGSIQAVAALKMTPNIWDGIALTGFSPRDAFLNFFELGSDFIEAQPLVPTDPVGYLAPGGTAALQEALLAPNAFDPELLPFLASTGSPPTIGEFLTLTAGDVGGGSPTGFTGPVVVVAGEYDVPFCGGNCNQPYEGYTSLPAASQRLFPDGTAFQSVVGMC